MKKLRWDYLLTILFLIIFTSFTPFFFGPGLSTTQPMGKFLNGNFQGITLNNDPYVPAYPNLRFNSPLNFNTVPGQSRIVVGQRDGEVYWFDDTDEATIKTLLIDLSDEVGVVWDGGFLGLTIHPEFGTNGNNYFYVYYTTKSADTTLNSALGFSCGVERFHGNHIVLERFEVNPSNLNYVLGSRTSLFKMQMYNTTHRGGGMEFGDDGFLYISTGDQAAFKNAQDIADNLDGGVLRIDVDQDITESHPPIRRLGVDAGEADEFSGIGYFIPNDNPFNDSTGGVFEEYYSMGHRSPHRMTKDRETGTFYIGEVGGNRHEEINVVAPGKNYGWPIYEANAGPFTSCVPNLYNNMPHEGPLTQFPRSEANSIIGGYVYRGTQVPNLIGKYICADYGTGDEIWAVDITTGEYGLLGNFAPENVISFGQDYQGELYMLKLGANVNLYKLAPTGITNINAPLLLSQTGAFSNLQELTVNNGILPYDMIDPFWSDGAYKKRWMAIPNNGSHDTPQEQIAFSEDGVWEFPSGAVLIKHFDYPIDDAVPTKTKKMETRFSVKGDDGKFYFFTYNWYDSENDAVLQEVGLDEPVSVTTNTGGVRQATWHFPSNGECVSCHNAASKGSLGPRTRYLNSEYDYSDHAVDGVVANQLVTLSHLGILNQTITDADTPGFLTHTSINDLNGSIDDKARSYMDLNCAYCHQPATGNRGDFDLRLLNSLAQTGLLTAGLNQQLSGMPADQRIIYPGDASKSQLYHRTASLNPSEMMPTLSKGVVDNEGIALLQTWINQLDISTGTLYEGTYRIVNRNNGETLEVSDSGLINGSNIGVGLNQDSENQQFVLEAAGNGYFQLRVLHSGLYLDVAWASAAPNTNVWQYTGNGTDAQLWELVNMDDGSFQLISKLGGHFLGIQPNGNVAVLPESDSSALRWEFIDINGGSPFVLSELSDQFIDEGEPLTVSLTASGGNTLLPLSFSATGLPDGLVIDGVTGTLSGSAAIGSSTGGPSSDGSYPVTVTVFRGSDSASNNFVVSVGTDIVVPPVDSDVVLRIRSAGPTVASTDGGPEWSGGAPTGAHNGSGYSVNTGVSAPASGMLFANRDVSIPSYIDASTYGALFSNERWDRPGAPEMEYDIPLANGDYTVNLYLGNFCTCTEEVGERVFGIAIEGSVVRAGLDLITEFGHRSGGMLSYPVSVTDGALQIEFLHGTENPLVNAIEIMGDTGDPVLDPLVLSELSDQFIDEGEPLTVSLTASGGNTLLPLSFSATGLPDGLVIDSVTGTLSGSAAIGSSTGGPSSDGSYPVTVTVFRGSDSASNNFVVSVGTDIVVPPVDSDVVLRIRSAGPTVASTDGGPDWSGGAPTGAHNGSGYSVNTGVSAPASGMLFANRDVSIPSYIDAATYRALFSNERWDRPGAPEMEYDIPLANGDYTVNLYLGNFCTCTEEVGERVFGIAIEGSVVRTGLDLITEFGHRSGGMLSYPVSVTDGALQIEFLHGTENPLVNAIEIMGDTGDPVLDPLVLSELSDQFIDEGEPLTVSLTASGGNTLLPLSFSATGLPDGLVIDSVTGTLSGSAAIGSSTGGPSSDGSYPVTVTVFRGSDSASRNFVVSVGTDIVVPPVDSDVVLRIRSAGPTVAATDGGPDWSGGAPTGAHNGSGYSVNTGVSAPASGMLFANRDVSIPSYIDASTYGALFSNERWDRPGAPEMEYDIPLANGDYTVNLYLGNFCTCTEEVGERVFGIAIEGSVVRAGLDLITEFGHRSGGMLSYPVSVTDGALQIEFLHGTENPLVNAIEIRSVESTSSSVQLKARLDGVINVINEIIVYPNPVSTGETIFVTMPNTVNSALVSLEIYNTLGSKVMEHKYKGNSLGVLEFRLDSGTIATGVYIIRVIQDGNSVKTQKLIVR